MLMHDMPFLAHARTLPAFMKRVERVFPKGSPGYLLIYLAASETVELYKHEFRFTGEPYWVHVFCVALIVLERLHVHDARVIVACIVHDNREHVQEKLAKGKYGNAPLLPDEYLFWSNDAVVERYGYLIEMLFAALTSPCVHADRSSAEAHRQYHRNLMFYILWRTLFQVKLADRLHNILTLHPDMGIEKIENKIRETQEFYLPIAKFHGILVNELIAALYQAKVMLAQLNAAQKQLEIVG